MNYNQILLYTVFNRMGKSVEIPIHLVENLPT